MRHPSAVAGVAFLVLLSLSAPAWCAEPDPVNRAIDRGAAALKQYLKGIPREGQSNPASRGYRKMGEMQVGVTALVTLTLLECGVEADDPLIQKRLAALRMESITVTHTYSVAVLILLLDRIGEADDVPLIHSLALRLLAGQYYAGGWSYYCPPNTNAEAKRLAKLVKDAAAVDPKDKKKAEADGRNPPPLPDNVVEQLKELARQRRDISPTKENFQGRGDDSNTQFAILALWVARRYGIPIGPAFVAADARFRKSQNADGGWGYVPSARGEMNKDTGSTPSMTCAGLMVLGMSNVAAIEAALRANPRAVDLPDLARDPAVRAGFAYLAGGVGQPLGPNGRIMPKPQQGYIQTGYYYLWSLERVGVGYNLKVIGNKDWYAWGAAVLVASQEADGYWQHEYGPVIDTCFALLFLKRVNFVKDLSKELKNLQSFGELMPSKTPK